MTRNSRPLFIPPLRRAAGERKGPIAQRWEGEVVSDTNAMCGLRGQEPTSPSPRVARVPFLSPRFAGGEDMRVVDRGKSGTWDTSSPPPFAGEEV